MLLVGTYSISLSLPPSISNPVSLHSFCYEEFLANTTKLIVLAGVRNQEDSKSIVSMNIPNLLPIIIDVAMHDSVSAAMEEVKKIMNLRSLPLVAIVNNAGIKAHTVDFLTLFTSTSLSISTQAFLAA